MCEGCQNTLENRFFNALPRVTDALPNALLLFIRQNDALPRVTAIFNNIYIYIYI